MVASNPTGFDFSLSKGIVSAYRWDYIQFDAKIKPGSSGGIVANLSGEVIGIVVALAKSEDGIAFAIPARDINQFLARGGN
jgi:S1-C subfamily serine protease